MNIDREYFLWASYRRKMLDYLQEHFKDLYYGVVLDIGGRDRGRFQKPKKKVNKWIFADINEQYNPDIILDVTDMNQIDKNSIDVINALELFEHVENIELGLKECNRILKKEGILILSVPFLFPIHADPCDFQRWTSAKWRNTLHKNGFKIENLIVMGKYYTHLAEIIKARLSIIKLRLTLKKFLINLLLPFLDRLSKQDRKLNADSVLYKYHTGYFIIARKE